MTATKVSRLTTVGIMLLAVAPAFAFGQTTATLYATADSGIASVTTSATSGTGLYGFQNADGGTGAGNGTRRMLIQWDLSTIPAGSTVNSAILRIGGLDNPSGKSYSVYRLTESWVEGNGGSNGGAIPSGSPSRGANWAYRDMDPSVLSMWTTPGGTFDPAATLTFTAGSSVSGYYNQAQYGTLYSVTYKMNFDITSIAQDWVNGTANNGVAVGSNEATYARMAMYGREQGINVGNGASVGPVPTDTALGVPKWAPALEVTYSAAVPEPSGLALLAVTGGIAVAIGSYRRRR